MWTLILSTFLYACESRTLTAEIERRIQALEMRCYRRLLNISYKDHVTNEEVRNRIQNATGVHDDILTMVKKRKLGMATSQDPLEWRRQFCKGQRKEGEEEEYRTDGKITARNGREWGLEGSGRQGRMERYWCNVICRAPTTSKVKGLRDERCI